MRTAWALAVDFIPPGTVSALTVGTCRRALNVITAKSICISSPAVAITGNTGWLRLSAVICSRKFWKKLGKATVSFSLGMW